MEISISSSFKSSLSINTQRNKHTSNAMTKLNQMRMRKSRLLLENFSYFPIRFVHAHQHVIVHVCMWLIESCLTIFDGQYSCERCLTNWNVKICLGLNWMCKHLCEKQTKRKCKELRDVTYTQLFAKQYELGRRKKKHTKPDKLSSKIK